jgi:metal-sulfur cluster biosynthetic enzyme
MPDSTAGIWSVIETALNSVVDPCAGGAAPGLVDAGLIDRIEMDGARRVTVHLHLRTASCPDADWLTVAVATRVHEVAGVSGVGVEIDPTTDDDRGRRSL